MIGSVTSLLTAHQTRAHRNYHPHGQGTLPPRRQRRGIIGQEGHHPVVDWPELIMGTTVLEKRKERYSNILRGSLENAEIEPIENLQKAKETGGLCVVVQW